MMYVNPKNKTPQYIKGERYYIYSMYTDYIQDDPIHPFSEFPPPPPVDSIIPRPPNYPPPTSSYTSTGTDPVNYDDLYKSIISKISLITKSATDRANDIDDLLQTEIPNTSINDAAVFCILDEKIETLDDLIRLGEEHELKYNTAEFRYNLDIKTLSKMVEPLTNLRDMIGMQNIKQAMFDKIIMSLQGLGNKHLDYNHIVLYGSPGMGKTHVAKIIGELFAKMGFLSKGKFEQAKLTDLKAGYVGQTELKTQKLLDKCKGSVLFIDEAYSIAAGDKIDSFSQSIIDIINPFLDKYRHDFILIIAGYKEELENRFFKANQGLKSRFGMWLEIEKYTGEDLYKIFKVKVQQYDWVLLDGAVDIHFFNENVDYFPSFGRDIENFFSKCKIAHAKRVIYSAEDSKKKLNKVDITNGLEIYIKNLNIDTEAAAQLKYIHSSLYT